LIEAEITVIIPAYNAENTIARAINSVLQNDLNNLKLIVIDDCSTDETLKICESIQDHRLIILKNNINIGVSKSRNLALKISKSDYVAFLDADDYWYKDKLTQQLLVLQSSDSNMIGCYTHLVINGKTIRKAPKKIDFRGLCINGNDVGMSSSIIKYSALKDTEFESVGHEDYKFWLKILANGGELNLSSNFNNRNQMTYYEKTQKSLSSNKFKAALWTLNILFSVLPVHLAIYSSVRYVIKHIKRYIN